MYIFLNPSTSISIALDKKHIDLGFSLAQKQHFLRKRVSFSCIVMQEASDAHSKTADSDTVSTYQVSSVQLVTDKKLEAYNKA